MIKATLAIIVKNNKILLAIKKRGFGAGKFNGPGGKLEKGETPQQAMIREAYEELKIKITKMKEIGKINFIFPDKSKNIKGFIFKVEDFEGNPQETEEMKPKWFDLDKIPYDKMRPDDKIWLPKVLENQYVKYTFYFDDEGNLMEIREFSR